jgi:hypothetical protein
MAKFRVTYWPGTDKLPSVWAKVLSEKEIAAMEKVAYIEAKNWQEAADLSFAYYGGTSDGTLVEYVKTCCDCHTLFYAKRDGADKERCPDCAELLTLA